MARRDSTKPVATVSSQRIVCWNIRAGGGKRAAGILSQLLAWQPQVIGLAEFRGTPASQWLAQELADAGFRHQLTSVNAKLPAKNALLLASRAPLQLVKAASMPRNRERWLLARVETLPALTLGLMHVPNYTHPKLKYPFLKSVINMVKRWDQGPALLLGDTNCGMRELDEENPQGPKFKREHDWLVDMNAQGFRDAFRHLHGQRREYTWYSHRDNGFRLDYAFGNPELLPTIAALQHIWGHDPAQPQRREALSDHAAVIIDLARDRI